MHDDFDGAPDAHDHRCGHARTVEDAKRDIDAWHEENDPEPERHGCGLRPFAYVMFGVVVFWAIVAYAVFT